MSASAKTNVKSIGRIPYNRLTRKPVNTNTQRIDRHTNPSLKVTLMREEKRKRAAEIRAQSTRLREERVTQETSTVRDHQVRVKTQREQRKRVRDTPTKLPITDQTSQLIQYVEAIHDYPTKFPIMEQSPQLIQPTDDSHDFPIKVPIMDQPLESIYPLTDETIMEVMDYIQSTAMERLLSVKTQTIAELAAMEIATMITNAVTDFYPRTLQEVETISTQLLMWVDMIINQALTVEAVADLGVYEAEAEQVVKRITKLEADPDLLSDVPLIINPSMAALIKLMPISTQQLIVNVCIFQPPKSHQKCFRWCKRTRLKSLHIPGDR